MKEFQKGILDNDRVIAEDNVQKMGEVIALCAIKTVIVCGGKRRNKLRKNANVEVCDKRSVGKTQMYLCI